VEWFRPRDGRANLEGSILNFFPSLHQDGPLRVLPQQEKIMTDVNARDFELQVSYLAGPGNG
jgi:membrane-bound lytic murein transglycosylase MltF